MNVLIVYSIVLIFLFIGVLFRREGFQTSPSTLFKDLQNKKALLLVYRTNCIHCNRMKPAWDKAAAKHPDKMVALDATTSTPELEAVLSKLNVTGYPTMFVMNNGEVVKQYDGGRSEEDISSFVDKL
jgi:thiol-disulfide isomerase/thioredoxin